MIKPVFITCLGLGLATGPTGTHETPPHESRAPEVVVRFEASGTVAVPEDVKRQVRSTVADADRSVRSLLPGLPNVITVSVVTVERDLAVVGGVTGRADAPGEVLIEISSTFPGGLAAAVRAALSSVLYHEFHHLARGWTITGNRFGPGIPTAVVNEGLASVFSETYTGTTFERFEYPDEASAWLDEILDLPLDADYNTWMNEHPDGRLALGYRLGRYVVHEALRQSGRSIVELSALAPEEILAMVTSPDS